MPTLDLLNLEKKKVGTIDLSDAVFGVKVNVPLVHQVIKAQLANRRQGTASTLNKGEVRGGGKKPYKQKGTGNARRGSNRTPLRVGGGSNFGPKPRSYVQGTPKKVMQGALRSALSDRVQSNRVMVVDSLDIPSIKTKALAETLKGKLALDRVLVVDEENRNLELSGRNIAHVRVLRTAGLNVYDVVRHEWLLLSKRAVQAIETRLGGSSKAGVAPKRRADKKAAQKVTKKKESVKAE